MGRYLLKFSKHGNLKYISHLDLLRFFQRAFKRAHVQLRYSQGFNPHARIGFAHPLSLGFESFGEYMEFETETAPAGDTPRTAAELAALLSEQMPAGMEVLGCTTLTETARTSAAAAVSAAAYTAELRFPADGDENEPGYTGAFSDAERLQKAMDSFLSQGSIITEKFSKKKRRMVENDIRPLIQEMILNESAGGKGYSFSLLLATGSLGNLNPQTLTEEFCRYCGADFVRHHWQFTRMELYFSDAETGRSEPLSLFKG